MLALSLCADESVTLKIGDLIAEVRIVKLRDRSAVVAIDAPLEISIHRNTGKEAREENRRRFQEKRKQPGVYVSPEVEEKLRNK